MVITSAVADSSKSKSILLPSISEALIIALCSIIAYLIVYCEEIGIADFYNYPLAFISINWAQDFRILLLLTIILLLTVNSLIVILIKRSDYLLKYEKLLQILFLAPLTMSLLLIIIFLYDDIIDAWKEGKYINIYILFICLALSNYITVYLLRRSVRRISNEYAQFKDEKLDYTIRIYNLFSLSKHIILIVSIIMLIAYIHGYGAAKKSCHYYVLNHNGIRYIILKFKEDNMLCAIADNNVVSGYVFLKHDEKYIITYERIGPLRINHREIGDSPLFFTTQPIYLLY